MNAGQLVSQICATVGELQALAPYVVLVWLVITLTVAMCVKDTLRTVALVTAILIALAIQVLPALLGTLGVTWVCS